MFTVLNHVKFASHSSGPAVSDFPGLDAHSMLLQAERFASTSLYTKSDVGVRLAALA